MPHRAIAVYRSLKDRANKDGTCYPSIGTIAKNQSLSCRTVQRAITDLEQTGHLQKEQRWRENGGKSSRISRISRSFSSSDFAGFG